MVHQVVFRSSIRRMRHVASKQKDLCRAFGSTTNNTTTNNRNNQNGDNNTTKGSIRTTAISSTTVDTTTSKVGSSSSFSADGGIRTTTISSTTVDSNFTSNSNATSVGNSSYSSNAGSGDDGSSGPEFRSVYVHPLSQVVLEYLQDSHHEWVVTKGLDRSLTLHRDGSFELKHVPQSLSSMPIATPTAPPSSTRPKEDQPESTLEPLITTSKSPSALMKDEQSNETKSTSAIKESSDSEIASQSPSKSQHQQNNTAPTIDNNENIRIWTSYDEQEKKHWLTVRRGLFRQRFLLQDNLLTAWQSNRGTSLPERLHVAVDEMIRAVDRLDLEQQQQAATMGQQQWQQKGQRRFRKR